MSDIQQGTIKERLARVETILCEHVEEHKENAKLIKKAIITFACGLALQLIPWVIVAINFFSQSKN